MAEIKWEGFQEEFEKLKSFDDRCHYYITDTGKFYYGGKLIAEKENFGEEKIRELVDQISLTPGPQGPKGDKGDPGADVSLSNDFENATESNVLSGKVVKDKMVHLERETNEKFAQVEQKMNSCYKKIYPATQFAVDHGLFDFIIDGYIDYEMKSDREYTITSYIVTSNLLSIYETKINDTPAVDRVQVVVLSNPVKIGKYYRFSSGNSWLLVDWDRFKSINTSDLNNVYYNQGVALISELFKGGLKTDVSNLKLEQLTLDQKINTNKDIITSINQNAALSYDNIATELSSVYNGTSSSSEILNSVTLSVDGDSLEFHVLLKNATSDSDFNNLAIVGKKNAMEDTVGFYGVKNQLAIRSSDKVWLFDLFDGKMQILQDVWAKIKIEYKNGNINAYINDTLKGTYIGQKSVFINNVGMAYQNAKFKGSLKNIIVKKNNTIVLLNNIDTDITYARTVIGNGFLSDAQNRMLYAPNNLIKLNNITDFDSDQKTDFGKIYSLIDRINSVYVEFDLLYQVRDTGQLPSTDAFRFGKILRVSAARLVTVINETVTQLNINVLIASENEFVLNFDGSFSCGFHGGERIQDGVFVLDGQSYNYKSNALPKNKLLGCDSIVLNAISNVYKDSSSMEYQCKRVKSINFNSGFKIENKVVFDQTITSNVYYFAGIMCNSHDMADVVTTDSCQISDCSYTGSERTISVTNKELTDVLLFSKSNIPYAATNKATLDANWGVDNQWYYVRSRVSDAKFYKGSVNKVPSQGSTIKCSQELRIFNKGTI